MSQGSIANPRIWVDADVYVAPVGTLAPTDVTTAWAAAWLPLGLLSEDGFSEARDDDETDHFAYGSILVRTTRSKHKRTLTVTVLEDNKTVWGLVNPGSTASTATGITTRIVKVPKPNPMAFGVQWKDGTITQRRIIPKGEAFVSADVEITDADMQMWELAVSIYPAADGTLYSDITNDTQAVVP